MRKTTIAVSIAAALTAQAFATASDVKQDVTRKADPNSRNHHQARPNSPQGTVLYDQSATTLDGGAQALIDSASPGYDSEGADDFVISDANGWTVTGIKASLSFNAEPVPADAVYNVKIFADSSGSPAATPTCDASGSAGTLGPVTGTGQVFADVSISLATPCNLPAAGTYWLSVTPVFNFPPQSFWATSSAATIGGEGKWKEAGGYNTPCSNWTNMSDCVGNLGGNPFQAGDGDTNYAFQILGSVNGGGGGCTAGGICLTVTLGSDTSTGACGTVDTLSVTAGDQVNFCYKVQNNTSGALNFHSLSDNINGSIFSLLNQPLAAGATYQYNRIVTAGSSEEINTATWTAQDLPPGYASTVTGGGVSDRIFCDGFDGTACSGGGSGGFIDITTTGTALGLADDGSAAVQIPFSFNFYGTSSNNICVGNNGYILFGTTTCPTSGLFDNTELPSTAFTDAAILPLWDDFDAENGDVYYATQGTAPNRKFIVEWFDRYHYDGSQNTDGATFEVIFDEATSKISFEYKDVAYSGLGNTTDDPDDCTNGVCATIGLQGSATLANQFSFQTASISNNSGIDWAATTPQIFTSTDTVTVDSGAPIIDVDPATLSGSAAAGASTTVPLTIGNIGTRNLTWTLDEAPSNAHFPSAPGTRRFVIPMGQHSGAQVPKLQQHQNRPSKPKQHASLPFGTAAVPSYGVIAGDATSYVSLDAAAPTTLTDIPVTGSLGTMWGGAFINNDFSKQYLLGDTGFESIDTTSGAITLISASTGGGDVWGMTSDPSTNVLYGIGPSSGQTLYTIDPVTGNTTDVAAITGDAAGNTISSIAINSAGQMYGVDLDADCLLAIDKTNGDTQCIGSLGIDTKYVSSLAFDQSTGILYFSGNDQGAGTNNMYTVDVGTGAATLISPIAGDGAQQLVALAPAVASGPCANPADVPWLSFNPASGTTLPGADTPVTVTLNAAALTNGVYDANVCVFSNDPANRTVTVPVEFTVGSAPPVPPSVAKAFAPTSVATGTASTLTITLSNTQAGVATLSANLVDTFPSGLVVATTPNASTTCGSGSVTAAAGAASVTLGTGATIPATGSCTVKVDVQSAAAASYTNTIPVGGLQTSLGNNTAAATAALTVTGGSNPNIVDSGVVSITVPATVDGLYINWVTGANGSTAVTGWDFNAYLATGNVFGFFWGGTSFPENAGVASATTGGTYTVLASGATIGPASIFTRETAAATTAPWQAGVSGGYLGVRFKNEGTNQTNYGYVRLNTTAPGGFPATITRYVYDKSGAAITIP